MAKKEKRKIVNFSVIEKKWQKKWEQRKIFQTKEIAGMSAKSKPKYYVLEQYPYPSGSGLHMGHAFVYTIGDIYARLKRMQGYNVLHPMGYDSFGLPAENAAIEAKSHPKKFTEQAIKNFIRQQKELGISYDWSRMIVSHDPEYYKWDQWIFLKMLERGLAYRKKAPVNWCSKCNTVLANEQVVNGKCWRHESLDVEVKHLEQWFLKTTDYAEELLNYLDKLDGWPETIKTLQRNWIGKSEGTEVDFEIERDKEKRKILIGTRNKAKILMIKNAFLGYSEIEFVTLEDFPNLDDSNLKEGEDFKENAHKKSEFYFKKTGIPTISTDQIQWVEKYSANNGFIVHIRKLVNPKSARASDEEVGGWIKRLVKRHGNSKANFHYAISYTDKNGTKDFVSIQREYILQKERSHKSNEGYIFDRYMKDPITGEFRIEQPENIAFSNFYDFIKDEFIPGVFPDLKRWKVFTTRPDTLFGVTFLVVSAQHPDLMSLVTIEQKKKVEEFLKKVKSTKGEDMNLLEKEGVFTGSYASHPLTGKKIPIWTGNFVVADYGSGMVMAVPAHDQRDFEFAKKYGLEIKPVIGCPPDYDQSKGAYTELGNLVNSDGFDGLHSSEAKEHITIALQEKGKGRKKVAYRLKDWLISRQRFWGTPIPIVYCSDCGIVPVPERDLPVKLPENIKFGGIENPLVKHEKFWKVKCPKCEKTGKRETDTMDTFVNSSWYYLRYTDSKNKKKIFEKKKAEYWMPIDVYIGGKEHACLHDIYFRFYTKFLRDLGLIRIDEPALRLFNQGFVHGEDGRKMSKSYGNVILPQDVAKKYGVDSMRMFLISVASPEKDISWSKEGIEGSLRFIMKVINFFNDPDKSKNKKLTKLQESKLHRIVKEYTSDLESFRYNLAAIKLRELFDVLEEGSGKKSWELFLKLLSPVSPHIAEELWQKIGGKGFVSLTKWPEFDEKKIDEKLEAQEKESDKIVEDIKNILKIIKEKQGKKGARVYLYVLPTERERYNAEKLSLKIGLNVSVFAVNDKNKYDPEGKSGKVKPGRPGIYVE